MHAPTIDQGQRAVSPSLRGEWPEGPRGASDAQRLPPASASLTPPPQAGEDIGSIPANTPRFPPNS